MKEILFYNKNYLQRFLIMEGKEKIICNWCNQPTTIIWVHGHGQCSACGYNIDECCRGENLQCNHPSESEKGKESSDDKN
ncbi:MAG: hypothetical protein HRF52_14855 [Ignavibacterium sp.]|uniref:hypothetical protein n=1 Tax=Ignavibacterium sp. TaxID=2651167 RepID=UPI00329844F8